MVISVALGGCQFDAPLTVVQSGGRLSFSVDDGSGRERCMRSINVYAVPEQGARALWHIERVEAPACLATIDYGTVPPGWATDGPAPALVTGATYRVVATGSGYNEERVFTAE